MKLYKEMLRKLAVVGLPLLAVTMVYSLVNGGSDCFGAYFILQSTSAISQIPVLRYYVFTGVVFALYGFSFQFSRAGSDVYHSLPVKRTDLYLSVLYATATWMGATILLNVLEMLVILLVSGCPFVPAYIPLSILYYFVASMLVYAATAFGCAVSGTIVTALASTGVVLLLPRYVQFLFARGVVERVPIIGWLDFGAWLDPTTNAATGILAMHLRQVYNGRLITLPHILYSLIPTAVMLFAGMWLLKRRPSEIAQKNGGHRVWTVVTAVLLAFAVMMPITMDHQKLFSVYGLVLMAAALGVFIVYQLIVSTKIKRALVTLPCFLLAVLAVLGISSLIDTTADNMLNKTPAASEIESVIFRGYDVKSGDSTYSTLLIQKIAFTDDKIKNHVSQSLWDAVEDIKTVPEYDYYEHNMFQVIEPVTIKLSGGGTIKRTIEFENINELNALRMESAEFAEAVRQFPPIGSVQYLRVDSSFTPEEEQAILESYIAEAVENNLLNGYYYRDRTQDLLPNGDYMIQGDNQPLTGISAAGYTGSRRYNDSYTLRLELPKTSSLLMRTYNAYAEGAPIAEFSEAIKRFDDGLAGENDSLSASITVYNYQNADGLTVEDSANFYLNFFTMDSESRYDIVQTDYMHRFIELLSRAVLTDETDGLFIRLDGHYHNEEMANEDTGYIRPTVYLRFENAEDEREFLMLFKIWGNVRRSM